MLRTLVIFLLPILFKKNVLCDTNYRLNSSITVLSYSIHLTPFFDTGDSRSFTFDGEVNIVLQTTESAIDQIKLHSEDLTFLTDNITVSSETTVIGLNPLNPVYFDKNYTFVYINLEVPLQPNVQYALTISYQGSIREDLNGFYRSYYLENGVKKWLGATQMEPTHARKVFPCLDEPQYKAVFLLTIDRPENYSQSLANTKLQTSVKLSNGYVREVFYPTPVMSTYLLAFLVSEYTAADYVTNGTQEFGVYTRPEAANQTMFASDFGQRVEKALSEFYGISYYSTDSNLKLDHVALPDFRAGAMENWGLIKYREALLLYVPEESTPYYKYRVAQIVAHETTHMWFGNLVTCHWWSNVWLNEGFANYFQDYITSKIEPELGSLEMLVTGSVYSAYAADELPTAVPITNIEVNSPSEISGHFGLFSYQKAGSVIRMMHHLIGDAAFKFGLNAYLEANKFSVGYPHLMYEALAIGVQNESSLTSYPGANIADVMSSWITQAGHPILEVEVDYDDMEITLKQKRFYLDSSNESDETYAIPVTYTEENNSNFENTKPVFIMNDKIMKLNVSDTLSEGEWIIFNIQETGFYRVNYDSHSWNLIGNALKGNQRSNIHHLNRAKIVNDLFAFVTADEVEFELLYSVLDFLKQETDYSVWFSALTGLNSLRSRYHGTDIIHLIDEYSLLLMHNVINQLGYDVKDTDSFSSLRNRMQILEYACKIGHQGCIDNAIELFKNFKENGVKITPSLRPVAYCNGLRHGSEDDYLFLWKEMTKTNVANEVIVIQNALGCTSINAKLNEYLSSILGENATIRGQDVTNPVTSVLGDHANADLVFDFIVSNYTDLENTYPAMETVITYLVPALHSQEQFDKFESWLSSCDECSEVVKSAGLSTLATAKESSLWAENHQDKIAKALRNYGVRGQHSVWSMVLASAVTLVVWL